MPKTGKAPAKDRVLDETLLSDVFGIELDEPKPPVKVVKPRRKTTVDKVIAKKVAKPAGVGVVKPVSPKKAAISKKSAQAKPLAAPRKRVGRVSP